MLATKREEKALRREIGNLLPLFFGIGSRFTARFLPVEIYEESVELNISISRLNDFLLKKLSNFVRFTDEFTNEQENNSLSFFVGSGSMNLNPTIVHLMVVVNLSDRIVLKIRALAKEGTVKQDSAKKAVEKIKNILLSDKEDI